MGICSVTDCVRQVKALGYCQKHYERFKTHGDTADRPRRLRKTCSVEGCDLNATGLGFCQKHYIRFKKTGDPSTVTRKDKPKVCIVKGCDKKHSGHGYCDTHLRRLKKYGTPTPDGVKFPSAPGEYLSDGVIKVCSTCFEEKSVSAFNKQKRRPDGLDIKCKECSRAMHAKRYADPVLRQRVRDAAARWRERNPDADADKTLRRKYGITLAQYDTLFEAQNGVCALCKKGETTKRRKKGEGRERLAVDHCHDTGRVRGLLCFKCNTAVGSLGDTEAGAQRVVDYLSASTQDKS